MTEEICFVYAASPVGHNHGSGIKVQNNSLDQFHLLLEMLITMR
jgi:hypothetical protein